MKNISGSLGYTNDARNYKATLNIEIGTDEVFKKWVDIKAHELIAREDKFTEKALGSITLLQAHMNFGGAYEKKPSVCFTFNSGNGDQHIRTIFLDYQEELTEHIIRMLSHSVN